MSHRFADITFTPAVQAQQERHGARAQYARMQAKGGPNDALGDAEAEFLAQADSFYLATVGETGWQLSHGEKSRLYIARALLQHAELVVLDESFASLDPENLRRALNCVLARAPTLLVIAHP